MKCSSKPWSEQWVGSRTVEERPVGFQNFCFQNRIVSKMLGAVHGLSRKLHVEFLCDIYKSLNLWTKSRFFRCQVWSGMANVCYYCKLNNMLMCEIM